MTLRDLTGQLATNKGHLGGNLQIVTFDAVCRCDEECPIYDDCTYDKKTLCSLRKQYIGHITSQLTKVVKERDEISIIVLTTELIPLYNQLVNYQIYVHSLNGAVPTGRNNVYKDMRECIKTIHVILKDLKTNFGDSPKGNGKKGSDLLNGDSSYYDELLNGNGTPS